MEFLTKPVTPTKGTRAGNHPSMQSTPDPFRSLQDFLDKALESRSDLQVLEAGCGSSSHVIFRQHVSTDGIDISSKQLARNDTLTEKILGDIQTYEFTPSKYDVIVCWTVLEHLPHPELAILNLAGALKAGGLLVLALPSVLSFKGLLTKLMPYKVHVLVYKYLRGNAGSVTEDAGPFRTYLRLSASPQAIRNLAVAHGLQIAYFDSYDIIDRPSFLTKRKFLWPLRVLYLCAKSITRLLSFGKLGNSEFITVLLKA